MEGIKDYCPMVDLCPHEPVDVKPDSYFLVQPFDSEKEEREKAIEDALKKFYGTKKYELKKSDSKISDKSIYCDICLKIKSSQFCIVDISGELHEIIDKESGKKESKEDFEKTPKTSENTTKVYKEETITRSKSKSSKLFLRPNVALELGMAYGFNKPALILSRKLNGKHQIPSDIKFVRYIDISFGKWSVASQKLLNRLRELVPFRPIRESLDLDKIKPLLHLKERLSSLRNINFRINQIVYCGGMLVGIIKDAEDLIEGIYFNFYVSDQGIEQLVGQLQVYHVRPDGLAQVEFYKVKGGGDYLNDVAQHCFENDSFVPDEHRLELIVPKEVKKIKLKDIKDIKDIIDMLS
jgi:hypothetical protein